MSRGDQASTITESRSPLTSAADAWAFFGGKVQSERSLFVAIAQQALAARHVAATAADAEDLVHDAVAHLVRHVDNGSAVIRPEAGILVSEIRKRAQRLHDTHRRRRTDPDPFDEDPGGFDGAGMAIPPDQLAIQRALLREVHDRRYDLHVRIARLARQGKLTHEQWEALRAVSRSETTSAKSAAVRKRASRCRQTLWPAVEDWLKILDQSASGGRRDANRLTAILEGTGLLQLSWQQLLHRREHPVGANPPRRSRDPEVLS